MTQADIKLLTTALLDAVHSITDNADKIAKFASDGSAINTGKIQESEKADHDLLIKISTVVENLRIDIKEIKDGTTGKLENHELRIQKIENVNSVQKWITGASIVLTGTLVSMLIYHLFGVKI